jgi:hypothetical protein
VFVLAIAEPLEERMRRDSEKEVGFSPEALYGLPTICPEVGIGIAIASIGPYSSVVAGKSFLEPVKTEVAKKPCALQLNV